MSEQSEALFTNVELALAAYATLVTGPTDDQRGALQDAAGSGMPPNQALAFAARYPTVVTTFEDPTTGLQLTVFKDTPGNSGGNLTVAFRGTTIPEDLPTGADIVGSGAAYNQIVAMANWWARASAPPDQINVKQFQLASYAPDAVPADAVALRPNGEEILVLEAAASAPAFTVAQGNLNAALDADPDHRVDLTGHSLGGHLAMSFSSLFSAQTGQVTVFNAPGFSSTTANQEFFGRLGGSIPTNADGNIFNVAADEALVGVPPFNFIARMHSAPGTLINIPIEDQFNSDEPIPFAPALNHSVAALADSLAVYRLLADL